METTDFLFNKNKNKKKNSFIPPWVSVKKPVSTLGIRILANKLIPLKLLSKCCGDMDIKNLTKKIKKCHSSSLKRSF